MSQNTVKVLELCTSPGLGGLELYMAKTVQWLRAHGGAECLALVSPNTRLAKWMQDNGVAHRFLRRRSIRVPLVAAKEVARIIDRNEVDILHIHWAKDLTLAVLAKGYSRRQVRLVYSRHMKITRSKRDAYHRWLYAGVDLFIAVTQRMSEEARQYLPLPPEHIVTNYLGAPAPITQVDCGELRATLGLSPGEFLVACVGRIEPGKAQHVLLEAMDELRLRRSDVHVVVVGEIFDELYYQRLQKFVRNRGLEPRVKFAGFSPEPWKFMSCADTVCLTTPEETFGLVLIEAMHLGVPVIGTAAGGVLEIIEDNKSGLLFPPGDSQALAGAIETLASDAVRRQQLARGGLERALRLFDLDKHFRKLRSLFFDLIARVE